MCRAVWKEDDQEEEGVIPSVWVKENTVMWPRGVNVLKAMKEMRHPDDSWIKFDLVKLKFSSGMSLINGSIKILYKNKHYIFYAVIENKS